MANNTLDLTKLRAVAEAATQGKWEIHLGRHVDGEFWASIGVGGRGPLTEIVGAEGNKAEYFQPIAGMKYLITPVEQQKANAEHIATFDPPTVLRMIEELERLRDALTQVRDDSRTPSEIKLWCGVALAQPAQEIKE